ncbi:hypothetical protein [Azospirillum sp. B510]|uniref:hypothetical protein n=1 Tax=Azospirillum sp. (strain B510) TaxID=137722 RepID=UPI0011D0A376|nr:hypothetical protein [Azospirillum sp. B510]
MVAKRTVRDRTKIFHNESNNGIWIKILSDDGIIPMGNNLSERMRVIIGCLGGGFVGISTYPIPAYKLLIADPSMEVTVFGWVCRIIFSAFVGGLWVFLNEEEHNRMKLFQLGIVGPAMISALISANSSSIERLASRANLFNLTNSAFAADGKIKVMKNDDRDFSISGDANVSGSAAISLKDKIKTEGTIVQKFIGGFTGNSAVIETGNSTKSSQHIGVIESKSKNSCASNSIGSITSINNCN